MEEVTETDGDGRCKHQCKKVKSNFIAHRVIVKIFREESPRIIIIVLIKVYRDYIIGTINIESLSKYAF